MLNLNDREWKTFKLIDDDMFYIDEIKTFKSTALVENNGVFDIVGATSKNNGNVGFLPKQYADYLTKGNCICLIKTGQGSVGDAVYKQGAFIPSNNVCVIRSSWLNRYNGMFMVSEINKQADRYSYGYIRNNSRIRKEQLMLPVTDNGQPDYDFMEQYIREREDKLKQKYIDFVDMELATPPTPLAEKTWKAFYIGDIFDTFIPGKSKGLNHLTRAENAIPYLGATNSNNGVMCFVEDNNKLKQHGNAIGFIKNGNGSAGYSIYKKEDFIATSDIIFAYAEWLTPYIGLFITTTSDMSQEKYSHGYKWTRERLVKSTIMLPTTDEGSPDYEYMEQYVKAIMYRKYKAYLEYKCIH